MKKPEVKNTDQIQKTQTRNVVDNDESDTVDTMSELEDLPKIIKCHQQLMHNMRKGLIFRNRRR